MSDVNYRKWELYLKKKLRALYLSISENYKKNISLNFCIHATSITHRQSPVSVLIKSSHHVSGTDVRLIFCHTQPLWIHVVSAPFCFTSSY